MAKHLIRYALTSLLLTTAMLWPVIERTASHLIRSVFVVLLLTAAITWPFQANAAGSFLTGNELYEYCKSSLGSVSGRDCLGYVSGVADALEHAGGTARWLVCIPVGVTRAQVKDVVTRFLEEHPEVRHLEASFLTALALAKPFPCK